MLVTNQRLDQLSAAQTDFENRGMLSGTQANEPICVFIFLCYELILRMLNSILPTATDFEHDRNGSIHNPINIPSAQPSILDEDLEEELATDLDVAAEVTLGVRPSSSQFVYEFCVF